MYIISFHRRKEKILSNYKIRDYDLKKLVYVRDLGIILSKNLSFIEHINLIFSIAICNFRFFSKKFL